MFWFNNDKRKRLIELMKSIAHDEEGFNDLIKHLESTRREISKNEILKAIGLSKEKKEIHELLHKVRIMIIEDFQLVHLLLELRRKGIIYFKHGQQQQDFQEILNIARDLLVESEQSYEFIKQIGEDMVGEQEHEAGSVIAIRSTPMSKERSKFKTETSQHFKKFIAKLRLFSKSENMSIEKIENDFRHELGISKKKLSEVEEGNLKVEVHDYSNERDSFTHSLVIFYHDYLVAEVKLRQFDNKKMVVSRTETFVKGGGYVQRAIELLLRKRIIEEWYSDGSVSPYAHRMYDRIADNNSFIVETSTGRVNWRRRVRLR